MSTRQRRRCQEPSREAPARCATRCWGRRRCAAASASAAPTSASSARIGRTAFWLLLLGASVGLVSLLFHGGRGRDDLALGVITACGYPIALLCIIGYDRLTVRAYQAISLGVGLLVTCGLYYGGTDAGYYRMFYVWAALFTAYHFSPRAVAVQVGAMCLGYGVVISVGDIVAGPVALILTISTLTVTAVVVSLLRRRLESQIHHVEEQNVLLRENDRLKDEFLATVSHELRTPLTSIRGYLDLALEKETEASPQLRTYLEVIDRNSERLLRQVSDLLLVAQIEAGTVSIERRPVDVQALAEASVDRHVGAAAAHGIAITLEALPVGRVTGDASRLAQLLDVLLSNAVKFTPAGGSVWVRVRPLPADAVEIEVADTGVGIPADQQERLFERFFRATGVTEQAVPGVGIGLTIARGIAEAHGGSVRCTSVEGVGSTFAVRLPGVPA